MAKFTKTIYYHDTDSGGVVYYANYLKYFEEARTDFFSRRGASIAELAKQGFLFAVRGVDISYRSPARYGQVIEIKTKLSRIGSASLDFYQLAELEGSLLVSATTKIACINTDFKPVVIPELVLNQIKNELSDS